MSKQIIQALVGTADAMGFEFKEAGLEIIVRKLAEHPEPDVLNSLEQLLEEHSGRFGLADILKRLPNALPGPEEAWNQALSARLWDEQTLLSLCTRLSSMRFSVPTVWEAGDKIGARMAFRERYAQDG